MLKIKKDSVCNPNPCQNGARCVPTSATTAICQCLDNFTGYLCEYSNPCLSSPCKNGATCVIASITQTGPTYRCNCPTGFTGTNCDVNINNQCITGYCFNSGTCNIVNGLPTCTCSPIFTGSRCEQAINVCFNSDGSPVCLNSASCTVNLQTPPYYQCTCVNGFFGSNCQFQSTTTTRLTSTVSSTSGPCLDRDTNSCQFYAANKYCSDLFILNEFRVSVPTYCPLSCNRCSSGGGSTCVDTQSNCAVWASLNLCPRLSTLNPNPCPKSCRAC